MSEQYQIYVCGACGSMVEVLHAGQGKLVCCDQEMQPQREKTEEIGLTEKHLPVIEKSEGKLKVKIGSTPHPMEEVHYIEWIQVIVDGRSYRKFLHPGDAPEAEFSVVGENIIARDYCNIHGLWKKT